jgi:putative flippase GtrA
LGYTATAGTAALVDVGGFVLLTGSGAPLLPAAIGSFLAAVLVNYLLSSRFVFKTKASGRGLMLFGAGALVGLIVNVGVTLGAAALLGLAPFAAKIIGIGTAFLFNYAINSKLVFKT